MIKKTVFILVLILLSCKTDKKAKTTPVLVNNLKTDFNDSIILSYTLNPKNKNLKFYWKNKEDSIIKTFKNLKIELEKKEQKLIFAVNGGMFKKDFSPQGLYIENGNIITTLDTIQKGYGNFYLQPNGIFSLSKKGIPSISTTSNFIIDNTINYATQSGPMLVINNKLHPKFNKGSLNLNIRNGVGILPNGDLLFAMSKKKINFYDFASYFKNKGCKNALYLDGFVSKTYLPSKNWKQLEGNFGVIIAETTSIK
ncbi:phosphodiester glycosidase family protein [uncultured Lacinutrix sp.]|uniref:phosphodiester glycosidase family protein n=1 Tax=uncultured Lacinutrix sp. TaxID=574032 RepID=UPI00262FBD6B|nr:phosphodiester glycosidase family protein [uncultured Lacinutrix sp.]